MLLQASIIRDRPLGAPPAKLLPLTTINLRLRDQASACDPPYNTIILDALYALPALHAAYVIPNVATTPWRPHLRSPVQRAPTGLTFLRRSSTRIAWRANHKQTPRSGRPSGVRSYDALWICFKWGDLIDLQWLDL